MMVIFSRSKVEAAGLIEKETDANIERPTSNVE